MLELDNIFWGELILQMINCKITCTREALQVPEIIQYK